MQAGTLKYPITIWTPLTTKNEFGEDAISWIQKYATRAKIVYNYGNRTNDNQEMTYDYSITFEVRRYVPINEFDYIFFEKDKVLHKYRILSIEPSQEKQNKTIRTELVNE